MTRSPPALPADASLADAAALMARERLTQVPVVGARGALLGVVSAIDVMRWMAQAPDVEVGFGAQREPECPGCAQMLISLCGDSAVQQAWFRRVPHVGLCSIHLLAQGTDEHRERAGE